MRRKAENFICGEDPGTEITPGCGSCRCGMCPVVGHNLLVQGRARVEVDT